MTIYRAGQDFGREEDDEKIIRNEKIVWPCSITVKVGLVLSLAGFAKECKKN